MRLLAGPIGDPVVDDPGEASMVRMMRVCLGENVPPEYAGMMREQMGFAARNFDILPAAQSSELADKPVVIAGAGVSGMALGASLLEKGIPFVIIEKKSEVGGTWRENIYPGCAVDTPNHAYSYSFGRPYPWSRYFSPRDELQEYLEQCATDFGLRKHIRFNTSVSSASWSEQEGCWRVRLDAPDGNQIIDAVALVSAVGQLSLPAIPSLGGANEFSGPLFHSAQWPRDLDIAGKRVAIIGTGATAMQVVPTIANRVESVTVYQRTPQWARPIERFHDSISDEGNGC